ncbi:malonic semialdehyde reductase [Formicincola oecophyllae]|uniref:malonic semialdehyde reductase n=1 Tax=Formicincola oecophyllae TaxID=2558361 RepID=UPI0038D058A5
MASPPQSGAGGGGAAGQRERQNAADLTSLFTAHRTASGFSSKPVEAGTIRRLYDLARLGPTSGNCAPARFAFITSASARQRMLEALSPGNRDKVAQAPLMVVVGQDPLFFDHLPKLNPQQPLRDWFASDVGLSEETAFRNSTLQGAYMLMAARALGLATLPLSGFDAPLVEDMFLREQGWQANFLIAMGWPSEDTSSGPGPRLPRLLFEEACLCL